VALVLRVELTERLFISDQLFDYLLLIALDIYEHFLQLLLNQREHDGPYRDVFGQVLIAAHEDLLEHVDLVDIIIYLDCLKA